MEWALARRGVLGLAVCILLAAAPGLGQDGGTVSLGVGAQKVLTVAGITRIALGDAAIADVKTLGNGQILVIGQSEGKTTLLVWKRNGQRVTYRVVVRKQDLHEVASELRNLLGEMDGIVIRTVGDRVYLDGQAYTSQDAERIAQVLELYPQVKNLVQVAPSAKRLIAQSLRAAFHQAGLSDVQTSVVGSTIFLEGFVESAQDLQKAELITRALGERVENLLVVGLKRMILSEVQFVEVRRSSRDRIGLQYPTEIAGSIAGAGAAEGRPLTGGLADAAMRVGVQATAQLALSLQESDGKGRLLAQPRLVCASGEKAELVAGGQVPIPLVTEDRYSVEYKPYGILLNLRPTADRSGNIHTEIEAEASEVDSSVAVSVGGSAAIPGFRTRRVKTSVTVRDGETIVLSGVFSDDEQKAVSKLAGLGSIPIIGELFKSRGFESTRRELVIFVTPRIIQPQSEEARRLIDGMKDRYEDARGEVRFNLFD